MKQQTRIKLTVVAVLGFIVMVTLGFIWRMNQPIQMSASELRINGAIELSTPEYLATFSWLTIAAHPLLSKTSKTSGVSCFLVLPTARISALPPWQRLPRCMKISANRKKKNCR